MCTRLYLDWNDKELAAMTDAAKNTVLLDRFRMKMAVRFQNSGEAEPKHLLTAVAPDKNGTRNIYVMRWGFKSVTSCGKGIPHLLKILKRTSVSATTGNPTAV